jgi:UDPglucose 6-dehydrogenase
MSTKFAIVGYGVVGRAMHDLLPEAVLYDVAPGIGSDRDAVNACDIAFVCVPTPQAESGACDYSAVEETVAWLETPLIVLRSTVPVGATDELSKRYDRRIVFQPEYLGETAAHPFADVTQRKFIILGGKASDTNRVADVYNKLYHSDVQFHFSDAKTAELAKYMENCFFAAKVSFCNEFYGLAESLGVEYNELRELWLADPRISRDHTFVYPDNRGFDGKCLPKDLAAIIATGADAGYRAAMLEAIRDVNETFKKASAVEPKVRLVPRTSPKAEQV